MTDLGLFHAVDEKFSPFAFISNEILPDLRCGEYINGDFTLIVDKKSQLNHSYRLFHGERFMYKLVENCMHGTVDHVWDTKSKDRSELLNLLLPSLLELTLQLEPDKQKTRVSLWKEPGVEYDYSLSSGTDFDTILACPISSTYEVLIARNKFASITLSGGEIPYLFTMGLSESEHPSLRVNTSRNLRFWLGKLYAKTAADSELYLGSGSNLELLGFNERI